MPRTNFGRRRGIIYVYITDCQKVFDCVNWTKLVQILKETGVDWRDRRLITKFYMDQNIKINWTGGRHWLWRLEAELGDDVVCRQYIQIIQRISLLLHRASCRFTNYHTTNKCTNCMSFIFKSLFKTLSLLLHVSIAYHLSSSGSTYSS